MRDGCGLRLPFSLGGSMIICIHIGPICYLVEKLYEGLTDLIYCGSWLKAGTQGPLCILSYFVLESARQ